MKRSRRLLFASSVVVASAVLFFPGSASACAALVGQWRAFNGTNGVDTVPDIGGCDAYRDEELNLHLIPDTSTGDYKVALDVLNGGWQLVSTFLPAANGTLDAKYSVPSANTYRWRIIKVGGSGAKFSTGLRMKPDFRTGARLERTLGSVASGVRVMPNCNPDGTSDCKITIKTQAGTLLKTCDAKGGGGTETCTYSNTTSNADLSVVWSQVSGTGPMTVSLNFVDYASAGGANRASDSMGSGKLASIRDAVKNDSGSSKAHTADGVDESAALNNSATSGLSLDCGWAVEFPFNGTGKINDVMGTSEGTSGTVTVSSGSCAGGNGTLHISANADFGKFFSMCITYTACICTFDGTGDAFAEGTMTATSGSFTFGARINLGVHCGVHNWACGYAGGFLKTTYKVALSSGAGSTYLVLQPGVEWHAKLAFAGPSGSASWTITAPL